MFLRGEFSRIARVSKRMLRHYDEIGLFTPEYIDPQTGYRYYSARQLPRLNRILALKDLGLSLDQISRMIDEDISLDEIRGMLLMQKAELERHLRDSLERIQRVEARLDRLSGSDEEGKPEVVLKTVPPQHFLAARRVFADTTEGQRFMGQLVQGIPSKVGRNALGPLMSVMYAPAFEMENVDSELGFQVQGTVAESVTLDKDTVLTVKTLPAIDSMATVVHIGVMDMLPTGYAAITEWMETHGYRPNGPQREIYLELPTPDNPDGLVTEIQFPVQKIEADLSLLTPSI